VNSYLRNVLLAAAILLVTLVPKFVVSRAALDTVKDAQQKVQEIKAFVISNGVRNPVSFVPNRSAPQWVGWRIPEPGCNAVAFPDLGDGDMTEVLHRARTPHTTTAFIYRGNVLGSYPRFRVATDKALARVAWAVRGGQWNKPLVVILFYSGRDCRQILGWDWAKLWR
jgi:hypothetical protein